MTGALITSTAGGKNGAAPAGSDLGSFTLNFNASSSNSVYQDNAQVTPYNFCQKMYIKI